MRLFTAVEFDKSMKEYLQEIQSQVINYSAKGNFTKTDNFHLTLVFLGELQETRLPLIKNIIDEAAKGYKDFKLELSSLGAFSRGNRKILWIGTKKSPLLIELYKKLGDGFTNNGFLTEKRELVAHITLGREVQLDIHQEELMKKISMEAREIPVNKISLMESTRINGELKYIPIYTAALN